MSNVDKFVTDSVSARYPENHEFSSGPGIIEPPAGVSPASASLIPAPSLATSRYNRQLLLPQLRLCGQEHLLASKVLIVGLGGLGSPAALYLAGAGIGTLGLMDGDTVEVSNLHRQIVHTESAARTGMRKVLSAATRCRELNSDINYVCHEQQASASNLLDIVQQYDLVLDCTDNPASRYLISDACVILGKTLISGAAQRGEGTLVVLNSPPIPSEAEEKGPCYRCVFPRPPAPETVRGCSEIGILGPVVGTIGTLMAGEAIKIISSGGHVHPSSVVQQQQQGSLTPPADPKAVKHHTMLLYNTYATDPRSMFRTITLRGRRKDCLACGDDEQLAKRGVSRITAAVVSQGRLDYQAFCGVEEDVKVLGEEKRVNAADFLETHARRHHHHHGAKRKRRHIVVDVREEHEFELGPKVRDSVNIPLSRILRHGGGAFDELELHANSDGGMLDQVSHVHVPVPAVAQLYDSLPSSQGRQPDTTTAGAEIGPDGGSVNEESHIPVTEQTGFPLSPQATRQPGIQSSEIGPDGGLVNTESHIPVTEESGFPSAPDRDVATQASSTIGPDGGLLNPESHILVDDQATLPTGQGRAIGPDGGMIDDESHIPVAKQVSFSDAQERGLSTQKPGVGPDGGMIDEETHIAASKQPGPTNTTFGPDRGMIDDESHIPMKRAYSDFSRVRSTDFPARPGTRGKEGHGGDKEDEDGESPMAVYFVCQKGNDSQIAAQKLIEHMEADQAAHDRGTAKKRNWKWIGDVKGGFVAMERHATWS